MKNSQNPEDVLINQAGFGHVEILIVVVAIGLIVGAGVLVANRSKKTTTADSINNRTSQSTNSKKTPATTEPKASTLTPQSTFVTNPSTSKPTTKPTSGSTSSTSASNAPATTNPTPPATPLAPPATPLSALTTIITNLKNNTAGAAQVTATNVNVAGPIGTATAQPIVFSVNGTVYFAYTQGTKPNFNQTAAQTANSMAITTGNINGVSLSQAHLDKSNNLVDENITAVGFSTGGN